jgi:hypothetical protein
MGERGMWLNSYCGAQKFDGFGVPALFGQRNTKVQQCRKMPGPYLKHTPPGVNGLWRFSSQCVRQTQQIAGISFQGARTKQLLAQLNRFRQSAL